MDGICIFCSSATMILFLLQIYLDIIFLRVVFKY